MRTISNEELKDILEKHEKWLNDKKGGEKADLSYADLSYADLQDTDLQGVNLSYADLRYAILRGADLSSANLRCAILQGADLREANLLETCLQCVNLQGANLKDANVYGAYLKNAYRPWFTYVGGIGSRRSETFYFADCDNLRCGCWNNCRGGTLTEFKAIIDEVYPADSENEEHQRYRLEYLSAIKMFETMREAYLKKCSGGGKSSEKNIE